MSDKTKKINERLARLRELGPKWRRRPSATASSLLADEIRDLLLEIEGQYPGHSITARGQALSALADSGIELPLRLAISQLEALVWWAMVVIKDDATLPEEILGVVRKAGQALHLALQDRIGLPNAGATFVLRAERKHTGRMGCRLYAYGRSRLGRPLPPERPLGNKAFVLLRVLWERRRTLPKDARPDALRQHALTVEEVAKRMTALGSPLARSNEARGRDLRSTANELRKKLGSVSGYRSEFVAGDRRKGENLYLAVPHTAVVVEDHVHPVEPPG